MALSKFYHLSLGISWSLFHHVPSDCFWGLSDLPVDLPQVVAAPLLEMFVGINILSFWVSHFVKAVHIELADEGRVIFVFVVNREHLFCEFGNVSDVYGISLRSPLNDRLNARVLHHGVKAVEELRNEIVFTLSAFSWHFLLYE